MSWWFLYCRSLRPAISIPLSGLATTRLLVQRSGQRPPCVLSACACQYRPIVMLFSPPFTRQANVPYTNLCLWFLQLLAESHCYKYGSMQAASLSASPPQHSRIRFYLRHHDAKTFYIFCHHLSKMANSLFRTKQMLHISHRQRCTSVKVGIMNPHPAHRCPNFFVQPWRTWHPKYT